MTAIILLLAIWAAGGFAAIGALKGVSIVEGTPLTDEVYRAKFIESWYAFGQVLTILLAEIGNQNSEKTEKK